VFVLVFSADLGEFQALEWWADGRELDGYLFRLRQRQQTCTGNAFQHQVVGGGDEHTIGNGEKITRTPF